MAKITRVVKGVTKATANKRAKKVVTTSRDSSVSTIRNKAMTYEGYLKKGKLTPQEAKDFKILCEKRPLDRKEFERHFPSIEEDIKNVKEMALSGEYKWNEFYPDVKEWYVAATNELTKSIQKGHAKEIMSNVNNCNGIKDFIARCRKFFKN